MSLATATEITLPRRNILRDAAYALARGFMSISENNARVRQMEHLQSLSDAALAKRGLRREDIVRHVFRDAWV